jgi:hypothetical protein
VEYAELVREADQLDPDRLAVAAIGRRALDADVAEVGVELEDVGADDFDRRIGTRENVAREVVDVGAADRVLDVAVERDVGRAAEARRVQVLDVDAACARTGGRGRTRRSARGRALRQRDVVGIREREQEARQLRHVLDIDVDPRGAVVDHVDEIGDEVAVRVVGDADRVPGVLEAEQAGIAPDFADRGGLAVREAAGNAVREELRVRILVVIDVEDDDGLARRVGVAQLAAVSGARHSSS